MEYVLVKFCDRFVYIACNTEQTKDVQKFCEKAISDLDLNNIDDVCVQLRHPLGAEIPPDAFPKLMEKYISDPLGKFYFELVEKPIADPIVLRLENALSDYLMANGMGWIFKESKQGNLSKGSRIKLINAMYSFTDGHFNKEPSTEEVINICKATISLLPCLRTNPSEVDGIDILFNPTKCNGFFIKKIRNEKAKKAKSCNIVANVSAPQQSHRLDDEELRELSLFFKNVVVSNDKAAIKQKLEENILVRQQIIQSNQSIISEIFPFYFSSPDLILFDFENTFENIDSDALLNQWPRC